MPPASLKSLSVVLSLGIIQVITLASTIYLTGTIAEPLSRDLRLTTTLFYILISISLLLTAFLSASAGKWLDLRGGREVQLCSSLVLALALCCLGLSHGLISLTVSMALLGGGMAIGNYGTVFKILIDVFDDKARTPIATVAFIGGLGSALGWPITSKLCETLGWRGACFVWSALHILLCIPLAAWIRESVKPLAAKVVQRGIVIWDRRMVQLAIILGGGALLASSMSTHLPRLLSRMGMTHETAAIVAGLMGVASSSARLFELTVMRKWPPLLAVRIASLLHPICVLGLLVAVNIGLYALPLGQGASNGLITVAGGVLPLALFGPENYGYRSALLQLPARFVQAGGPLIFGLLLSVSPGLALAFTSAVCLLMFAMTFGLVAKTTPLPSAPHA